MNKLIVALCLIASVIILVGLYFFSHPLNENKTLVSFSGKDIVLIVEIANTPDLQKKGLMNRTYLPEENGMFFIFDTQEEQRFWMKNTLIPLDMLFITENFTIVSISENTQPCISDPCKIYSSVVPAKYVLEVNAGFAEKNGMKIGDKIKLLGHFDLV